MSKLHQIGAALAMSAATLVGCNQDPECATGLENTGLGFGFEVPQDEVLHDINALRARCNRAMSDDIFCIGINDSQECLHNEESQFVCPKTDYVAGDRCEDSMSIAEKLAETSTTFECVVGSKATSMLITLGFSGFSSADENRNDRTCKNIDNSVHQ